MSYSNCYLDKAVTEGHERDRLHGWILNFGAIVCNSIVREDEDPVSSVSRKVMLESSV